MPVKKEVGKQFQGFSRLDRSERFQRLLELGALTEEDLRYLTGGGIQNLGLAEKLIENVIGYFQLPLGVATNFCIDGRDYVIPMAVEETSIIAAASKTAKWIRQEGKIETRVEGDCILGQIQFARVKNFEAFSAIIDKNKIFLIEKANEEVAQSMVKRGGGVKSLCVRRIGKDMAVIHLTMNSCDAMGANILNQVLEYLKNPLEALTDEQVSMCILTNLNDQKLTTAEVIIHEIDAELGQRIEDASLFAEQDTYRAATHNKGVMNGMDPVVLATGNDWRAVEAAVHAYASQSGQYKAISKWRFHQGQLRGQLTAPIIVGTVGGVTALHPTASLCLRMMGIESANHLSRIIAAVGLVQNLGAIRALCTEGIIQGHMKLHIDNLLLVAGATEQEMPVLKDKLKNWLSLNNRVSLSNAKTLLTEIRGG